jgi:hypothetical protein
MTSTTSRPCAGDTTPPKVRDDERYRYRGSGPPPAPRLTLVVVEFRILSAGWRPTFAASRHDLATSPEKA